MMIIVTSKPRPHVPAWQKAAALVGLFAAIREHLVREAALAAGYERGRSDAMEELFWRFVRSGDAMQPIGGSS